MDCFILPVSILTRCYTGVGRSSVGYRPLLEDVFENPDESPVTVVVGKERRKFLVDPFVLEESPFRVLIEIVKSGRMKIEGDDDKRVIFVDVDAILFEHMLWLMNNDCSSFFKLNLREIIDFYSQE